MITWALVIGHLAWNTWLGPPFTPDPVVGGRMLCLRGTDPAAKHLYLRREIYLAQRPRSAWIHVIARDEVHLYVNGERVGEQNLGGFPVAVVADLATYLKPGKNVIAIASEQASIGIPPAVSVTGGYTLGDGEHALGPDESWRCRSFFERTGSWWFAPDFHDRHWPRAERSWEVLESLADVPPRSVIVPDAGPWITPRTWAEQTAAVRRDFSLASRPTQAWLRVTATSSYRLAVNGILIDTQEDQAGTPIPIPVIRRTYDITNLLRTGTNGIALLLSSNLGPPHVRMDAEVETLSGPTIALRSDGEWRGRPGFAEDWLRDGSTTAPDWEPCVVESNDLGIPPWSRAARSSRSNCPGTRRSGASWGNWH